MDASTIISLIDTGLRGLIQGQYKSDLFIEKNPPIIGMIMALVDHETDIPLLYSLVCQKKETGKAMEAADVDWDRKTMEENREFVVLVAWSNVSVGTLMGTLLFWAFANAPEKVPEIATMDMEISAIRRTKRAVSQYEKMFGLDVTKALDEKIKAIQDEMATAVITAIGEPGKIHGAIDLWNLGGFEYLTGSRAAKVLEHIKKIAADPKAMGHLIISPSAVWDGKKRKHQQDECYDTGTLIFTVPWKELRASWERKLGTKMGEKAWKTFKNNLTAANNLAEIHQARLSMDVLRLNGKMFLRFWREKASPAHLEITRAQANLLDTISDAWLEDKLGASSFQIDLTGVPYTLMPADEYGDPIDISQKELDAMTLEIARTQAAARAAEATSAQAEVTGAQVTAVNSPKTSTNDYSNPNAVCNSNPEGR